MRATRAARRDRLGRFRRALASLLCLAAAAGVAAGAHAHADHAHGERAFAAAPSGAPCSGELAHGSAVAPTGAQCRSCQWLSQARAALPRGDASCISPPTRRAAQTAAQLSLVAQRTAAAHPSRAPPEL
jgi:hypothetical protein